MSRPTKKYLRKKALILGSIGVVAWFVSLITQAFQQNILSDLFIMYGSYLFGYGMGTLDSIREE